MIYKNIKERQEHKIEILSNKIEELERKSLENVELYTDNVLLKRQIKTLQTQVQKGKELISKLQKQLKK